LQDLQTRRNAIAKEFGGIKKIDGDSSALRTENDYIQEKILRLEAKMMIICLK
jgi:hypothetical protein